MQHSFGLNGRKTVALVLAALCVLLVAGPARAAEEPWVEAEGVGTEVPGCPEAAREEAVHDAQRNAVEQVLGVILSSETLVSNYAVIEDRILTRVSGYVSRYEVVSERPAQGMRAVEIRAEVARRDLADDVAALAHVLPLMNYPVLLVAVGQTEVAGDNTVSGLSLDTAQTVLAGALADKGFRIADASALDLERLRQANLMEGLGDETGRLLEEASHRTQVVVAGTAVVQDNGPSPYSDRIHSYGARVTARAYATVSGRTLATASFEANVAHHSFALGTQAALEKATRQLADVLSQHLVKAWLDECYNGHDVELVVEGVPFSALSALEGALGSQVRGVQRVARRAYLRTRAELVLGWNSCDTMRLAESVDGLSCGEGSLAVLEVTGNTIRASYGK